MLAETLSKNADLMSIPHLHVSVASDRILTLEEMERDDAFRIQREALREADSAPKIEPDNVGEGQNIPTAIPNGHRLKMGKCLCGCGMAVALDQWAHQQYAPGHGGKELYKRRIAGLKAVLEGLLIAWGWGLFDAVQMAGWWVNDRLSTAQQIAAKHGYAYLDMKWIRQ